MRSIIPRDLQAASTDSSSQTVVPYTHTQAHARTRARTHTRGMHTHAHTHTPLGKSRSNLSLYFIIKSVFSGHHIVQFNIHLHITVQNYAVKRRFITRQTSVNHYEFQSSTALYSLTTDRIRSETSRCDF